MQSSDPAPLGAAKLAGCLPPAFPFSACPSAYERPKAENRQRFEDLPDPKKDLAAYLATRFGEARWEIS